ncbi:probable aspartic protease At2g35615 [Tripterygium wilfordii]|uniref:probable aspartic protease At2g35615 n=1 Tax=Tripterygium wilfordii TaxID=458696 RepID=UPI0018F8391E|nr:probable aspartic protease At2g35615 [Tripterygium wilfordii]
MNSFSFDLIHHDSKLSPFYDRSKTESERSIEAFIRSLNHLNHFNSSLLIDAKYVESDLTIGDYLMNIYIGKPNERHVAPITRLVIPSMSSGLTWIRCDPCSSNCENQHQSLYDPKSSETYHGIPFDSKVCIDLQGTKHVESNLCQYEYRYGYKEVSSGVLGTETFYLRSPEYREKNFSDIVFGCDEAHQGDFKVDVQGVVGLGQGPFSLVSQVAKKVGKKFSYCLVKKSSSSRSKIKFGSNLQLYNQDEKEYKVKFEYSPPDPSYHLNLEAISINGEKIKTPNKKHDMIVDIQTSLTSLPPIIYNAFIAKFKEQLGDITSIQHPKYGTCFQKLDLVGIKSPRVVFHFSHPFLSDGDFLVNPTTMFREIIEYMCLTIVPIEGVSVLGNKAQIDRQMIFDVSSKSITFAPLDCIKVSF